MIKRLVGVLVLSAIVIALLSTTPISRAEIPMSGGGSFIPAIFLTAAVATVDVFAIGTAVWIGPKIAFRNRVRREIGEDEFLFMIQATESFKSVFSEIAPSLLTTVLASTEGVRFFGAGAASRFIASADITGYRVEPKGYRDRIPTIVMSFHEGAEARRIDFVLARDGFELVGERRLEDVEATRRRLEELASQTSEHRERSR